MKEPTSGLVRWEEEQQGVLRAGTWVAHHTLKETKGWRETPPVAQELCCLGSLAASVEWLPPVLGGKSLLTAGTCRLGIPPDCWRQGTNGTMVWLEQLRDNWSCLGRQHVDQRIAKFSRLWYQSVFFYYYYFLKQSRSLRTGKWYLPVRPDAVRLV